MKFNEKIIAMIMIGGQSRRMGGGIKGFVKFNNKNIFERVLERAEHQIDKIIINCNVEEPKLEKYNLPIIKDLKDNYMGPLAGIHSAMHWIKNNDPKTEWLITLPGDTPFIPKNLVSRLKVKMSSNSKIILVKSKNKIHPIIGAWRINLFDNLDLELEKGTRKILSWAELHPIDFVSFTSKKYDPFFNINKKEDLELAKQIEKKFL